MCSPKNSLAPMTVSTTFDSIYCGFFPKRNGSLFIRDWQTSANGKYKWSKGCDYYGNDLLPFSMQFNISDYVTCAEYCQSHLLCTFFTFNKLRSICFPKASSGNGTAGNQRFNCACLCLLVESDFIFHLHKIQDQCSGYVFHHNYVVSSKMSPVGNSSK